MCTDCERKDRVIEGLKQSVIKQARLEQITALYQGIRISPEQLKERAESFANSNLPITDITMLLQGVKDAQDHFDKMERKVRYSNGYYR